MSYTPTEWQTGDTITAEKLNNMESGITQTLVVHAYFDASWALVSVDHTPYDVADAIIAGKRVDVIFVQKDSGGYVLCALKAKLANNEVQSSSDMEFFAETRYDLSSVPPVLYAEANAWAVQFSGKKYTNASYEMGYPFHEASTGEMEGYVYGFNRTDVAPFWRPLNGFLPVGNLLDPLIEGAMQAAQLSGGKATITTALSGDVARDAVDALHQGFKTLKGGMNVVYITGEYYIGAVALTTRMYTDDGEYEFTDMQTGKFQIPEWIGTSGTYTIGTVWDFTLSIFTKLALVSDEFVPAANLVLTAEEISPTSV